MDNEKKSADLQGQQEPKNLLDLEHTVHHEPDRSGTLDDEQRVKVLSPGMMVFKRFVRNRLAITGFIILLVMFAFSFIGGMIMPYSQSEVFYKTDLMVKEYAGATINKELRYTVKEGEQFSSSSFGKMILAYNRGESEFENGGHIYTFTVENDDYYKVSEFEVLSRVLTRKMLYAYTDTPGFETSKEMRAAFEVADQIKADSFTYDGQTYSIVRSGKETLITKSKPIAVASPRIYDAYREEDISTIDSFPFRLAAEEAISRNETSFVLDGQTYTVAEDGRNILVSRVENGQEVPYAGISDIIVNAILPDVFLTIDFKTAAREAILSGASSFDFPDAEGNPETYEIELVHATYNIKKETTTRLIDMHRPPDAEHLLGTDQNGMDMLTRLMYGGRISLLVGFVVVFLEMLIGIIVGGISGYFGGWVDTMLMRFVDLFNSIPYWPIMIIVGSVMDTLEVNPYTRVLLLMIILGLMGWTGIARVVRGQILALREQDFMVATEATGIRVSRRIFRHLVPNVMPLLIVQGTMSLGSIILTEATLSFLGLGVKYPIASWGSIINAASQPYIVMNYWFIWVPAGLLILFTVLGFNFVGDGLRDAFDPKMKR
jgi:peptide/nickel transport system permease protein